MSFNFRRPKQTENNYRYIIHRNELNDKIVYDEFATLNCIVFNPSQSKNIKSKHIKIRSEVWPVKFDKIVPDGYIYLNKVQRSFYGFVYGESIEATPFIALSNPFDQQLEILNVDIFSMGRKMEMIHIINYEHAFKSNILQTLKNHVLSGRQPFTMHFENHSFKIVIQPDFGKSKQTYFEVGDQTQINIKTYNMENTQYSMNIQQLDVGGVNGDVHTNTPLQSWNLKKEGVGGLGEVANELFRRAFASRQNPVQAKKLGTKHVKGVLLHGPPGVGKTLIARTIASLLNKNIPPKIVSGPEIFDKYVGESQRKIRELFTDAENDEKKYGDSSPLHVFIFDEFDSIGRKRSSADDTGSSVASQVVNQLLVKMDGHVQLNNILIIALTNRIDIIDSALLRPGRFEIQIEVKLPNQEERKEIFDIHTKFMNDNDVLHESISLSGLSKRAENFTGAEIEGLVKSAASYALTRTIKIDDETQEIKTDEDKSKEVIVLPEDFEKAFDDIKPQFGIQQHQIFSNSVFEDIVLPDNLEQVDLNAHELQTVLIQTDKTQKRKHEVLVGKMALESGIHCLMCIDYFDMIGMNELQACKYMKEVYIEASKTQKSLIVINHLDTILGIRYNPSILQTVITLLRYYNNVTTIATVDISHYGVESMELDKHFDVIKTV